MLKPRLLSEIDEFLFEQFEVPNRRESYDRLHGDKLLAFEKARELRDAIRRELLRLRREN